MPAPALVALRDQRLSEIESLCHVRPARHPSRPTDSRAADAVNRAGVVVLTAHLEGYVEDLVVDIVDVLNRTDPNTDDLPRVLLAAHVVDELGVIAEMTDVERRAHRIDNLFRSHSELWLDEALPRGRLDASAITAGFGNPGSKAITRVFTLVGLDAVFSQISLPDGADPERRINELVGVRNAIAHGGGPSIGDPQLRTYIAAVEAVGEGLEQAAAAHLQTVCRMSTLPWT